MRFYSRLLSLRSDNIVHPLTKTHHVLSPFCSFLDLQCQQILCNSNIISISVSMETIPLLLISRTHTHTQASRPVFSKERHKCCTRIPHTQNTNTPSFQGLSHFRILRNVWHSFTIAAFLSSPEKYTGLPDNSWGVEVLLSKLLPLIDYRHTS